MRLGRFVLVFVFLLASAFIPDTNARQTSSSIQAGYIRLVPDTGTTSPAGVAIFGLRTGEDLVTETSVPSTPPILSGRIFVDIGGTVNTGIAMANSTDNDAIISYYFTDIDGKDLGAGTFTLLANHQISSFLTEQPFDLTASSLTGTFTFSSSHPIAAVGMRNIVNVRGESLMTTVPVSDLDAGFGGDVVLVPNFPGGAGWTTEIVLVNPGDSVLRGAAVFFADGTEGEVVRPLVVNVDGIDSPIFTYTVQPRSAFRISPTPVSGGDHIGAVRIIPYLWTPTPSSLAISSYGPGGKTVSVAGAAALPAALESRMYIESSGDFGQTGSIQTGIKIWNPSASPVTIEMKAMKLDGTWSGLSTSLTLPPLSPTSRMAKELFPQIPSSFQGVLIVKTPSPIVVTGLRGRYNSRGDLLITQIPVYDDASAPMNQTIFPHFISGPGYSTQVILLSTGAGHSGSLLLMSQEGEDLPSSSLQQGP